MYKYCDINPEDELELKDVKNGVAFTVINKSLGFPIHCGVFGSEPYEQYGQMMALASNVAVTSGSMFCEPLSDMGLAPDATGYTPRHIATYPHPSWCDCGMKS